MPKPITRRGFTGMACGVLLARAAVPVRAEVAPATQRVTIGQIAVTRDVSKNLERIREVIADAERTDADWTIIPEMALSGYYGEFDQAEVAAAFDQVSQWCRRANVVGLIGTGWKEQGKTYNQIRIVGREGQLVSKYAKTCLCYGEDDWTEPGPISLVHDIGGLRIGTLICNDLWVTPGFTDGPNPHLSMKIANGGAQVLFHAINSGADQRYRAYHEANLLLRAAEAKFPIVACNAYMNPAVNATSGVVGPDHAYLVELPRDREVIATVEFTPKQRGTR